MNLTPSTPNALDPFHGLRNFQREVSRLFETAYSRQGITRYPLLNVQSNVNGAVVTAEIPGTSKENLEITLDKGRLTISGTIQNSAPEQEGVVTHQRERTFGAFSRSLVIPFEVEEGSISATYTSGVLEVTLPRSEKSKPKTIPINAN